MAGQPGNLSWYLSLVTSEHNQKPNFMATLAFLLAPLCSLYSIVRSIPTLYDLDLATGAQLDTVGLWIGQPRTVQFPLPNIFITHDTAGLGFDGPGIFFTGYSPSTPTQTLNDPDYRTLLRATAANNQWDGTIAGAYAAINFWTQPIGCSGLIYDFQDMTCGFMLLGSVDATTLALFNGGKLFPRSEGVGVRWYVYGPPPLFGFDTAVTVGGTLLTAGFDQGSFASYSYPSGAF